jgi:2-polyprenyl-3-methyl-5-hydroxy-6-metoxy-1,4-benzoquinol methylase
MNKADIGAYARNAKRINKDNAVADACKNKSVLDVGCIGQDRNFANDNWLHNKVRGLAAKADGVDILVEEVNQLKKQGYSMYTVDELQLTGNKYDLVLMADVIEHVNDPVSFLKFYADYLKEGGSILVSTPNSNRVNNFINILFNNNYSVNPEHTCWFCPRTIAEVADRANLNIDQFHWANHYYTSKQVKGLYQKFKYWLGNILISMRSNFSPNMIIILSKR